MQTIKQVKFKSFTWVHIPEPTSEDIHYITEKYKFHSLDIEDVFSENERSKVDEYQKYLFIVMHFPVLNKRTKLYTSEEIDFFLGKDYLITLHGEKFDLIDQLFQKCLKSLATRKTLLGNGGGYLLYEIMSGLFDDCFPQVDKITTHVRQLENAVFESGKSARDLLYEIMIIKRQVINLRRVVLPQRSVVLLLEDKVKQFVSDKMDVYFDDIVDKIEKLWSNLGELKEFVESLQETNESIISHNTNNIIKTLTIFSVIMLPLTFITGLYGMNVSIPFASGDNVFGSILIMMSIVVLVMLLVFKLKKWL